MGLTRFSLRLGLGEVYKARDSRLERTVAIKVLPEHLAESAERKERFEREAKAISQLNHPHICTLHDIGNQDGIDFLVMEYIVGETLADRLKRGPLTYQEAVTIAIQIAAALNEAHRHGIVHRDLKPGNIVLTESGVKLLDFGLAKLMTPSAAEVSSELQTEAKPLTSDGAILGTFQYMAPEQIDGEDVDARRDLFAFGVVLYEMLTGKKAFEGKTQASLIAAILEREPASVSTIQPLSPRSLDRIVSRCLAKDPAHRWESARDVREVLSWIEDDSDTTAAVAKRPTWLPWAVAAVAVAASVVTYLHFSSVGSEEAPVGHFSIKLPRESAFRPSGGASDLAISPDGEHLVYLGGGGPRALLMRRLAHMKVTTLVAAGFPRDPFFSPDSEWVGFADRGALKKVSVRGGPTVTLWEFGTRARGASWGPNDEIIFATGNRETGLLRVPAAGGEPEVLTVPDSAAGELDHVRPEFLPGGETVLFDIVSSSTGQTPVTQIAALSLETGEWKILIPGGANARYASTGHIVYVAEGALRAVRFDAERLELLGNPFPVLEEVNQKRSFTANFSVSTNGTLAYNPNSGTSGHRLLMWVDRDGRATPLPLPPAAYNAPSLSPDGRHLALSITDDSGANIWVYDIERGTLGKRTFGGRNTFPIWTPDGEEILYSEGDNLDYLARLRADGSSRGQRLMIDGLEPGVQVPTSWSDVHRVLLFLSRGDSWKLSLDEEAVGPFLTHEGAIEREARFSPDQRFVAYRSDETGRDEVYVVPFPGPGGKWQISTDGGAQTMWAPRGGELFYKSGDRMMVVSVSTDQTFEAGTARVLFQTALAERAPGDPFRYAVSADGQRFLITAPAPTADEADAPEIHVIVNWFRELERLTPGVS